MEVISNLEIILLLVLLFSLTANGFLIWFIRKSIRKLLIASETASSIFTHLDAYREHIASAYELKEFYGDSTIKKLIEHTTDVLEYLKNFENIYSLTQPELEDFLIEESDKIDNFEMSDNMNDKET